MKGFSNQLIEKHRYLKYCLEEYEDISQDSLEKVKCELDKLINLQQFLNVTGLHSTTTKVRLLVLFTQYCWILMLLAGLLS